MRLQNRLLSYTVSAALVTMVAGPSAAAEAPALAGVWKPTENIKELKGEDGRGPPLLPKAAQIYASNKAKLARGDLSFDPTSKCVSPGLPRILYLPYPFRIIQSDKQLTFLFQWNYWNRRVDMTGKARSAPYKLSLGVSRGRLRGNVVEIRTDDLSGNTLLDAAGVPHSDELRVVERMRLLNTDLLEDKITLEDPATFRKPWTTVVRFKRLPADTEIAQDICLDRIAAGQPAVDWK